MPEVLMRLSLYWNPSAGDRIPLDEITRAITRAGHVVAGILQSDADAADALRGHVDALVAAGGDGTVARAARSIFGAALPIAILPLGTANNIATSLGINDDPFAAIAEWGRQSVVRIDVGIVTDDVGDRLFIEGVGTGLVPRGINRGQGAARQHESASAEVEWAREMFLGALSELATQPSRLRIDGEDVSGDYLLVEVLNIASVGPRLRLSAETTPADGLLSVVTASEVDRGAIRVHLERPSDDRRDHAWLKSWRARHVEVSGWHEYHVDDEVHVSASGELAIAIRPSCLAVLA